MSESRISWHTEVDAAVVRRLSETLGTHLTLRDAVAHAAELHPPRTPAAIVTQDEYTHDVVIEFDRDLYVVYDVTWLGVVDAISVWDRLPSADELLAARVAAGWRPQVTATAAGDQVLGHACAVPPRQ